MAPSANPRIVVFVRTGCLFAKSRKTRKQALIVRPMVFDSGCFMPLTLVPTHLDLDHPPFIVYQLINYPMEDAEFHARFDYQRTFFFSGCLDLMILCVFGPD